MNVKKMLVELWGAHDDFAGLIIEGDTGVLYTNQVGGTRCAHPKVEGYLVPMVVDLEHCRDLITDYWVPNDLTDPEFEFTEDKMRWLQDVQARFSEWLNHARLPGDLRLLGFEERFDFGQPLAEAWIPCMLRSVPWCTLASGEHPVIGRRCVLTFGNSD